MPWLQPLCYLLNCTATATPDYTIRVSVTSILVAPSHILGHTHSQSHMPNHTFRLEQEALLVTHSWSHTHTHSRSHTVTRSHSQSSLRRSQWQSSSPSMLSMRAFWYTCMAARHMTNTWTRRLPIIWVRVSAAGEGQITSLTEQSMRAFWYTCMGAACPTPDE